MSGPALVRAEAIEVEAVGRLWAAYSPSSGETLLLNDESAAVLEVLEAGPATVDDLHRVLAADGGHPDEALRLMLAGCLPRLIDAGLVCEVRQGPLPPR